MSPEDRKSRVDRELIELLNELRVALPGVQVLFAFLLVVPFQQGFQNVSDVARDVYFAGLASSAIAIAFLIAPASYHRLNLRRSLDEKEHMLFTSSRLTVIGTAFLAIGIACSMFLIADVLFGPATALVVALATVAVIGALWYALPLIARGRGAASSGGGSSSEE
jgi:amino acid transporter